MPVSIKGSGGGSVTLDASTAASDTTLTLPNTTGTVALTASPTFTGTVTFPGTGVWNSSGNVGIGTTSPSFRVTANYTAPNTFTNASGDFLQMWQNGGVNALGVAIETTAAVARFVNNNGYSTAFNYSGTSEAMRIDTSGNLLVGTTSGFSTATKLYVYGDSSGNWISVVKDVRSDGSSVGGAIGFYRGATNVGGIQTSTSSTSYVTSSDYRLKENVAPMTTGLATISALKPVTYDWISDKSAGEGFIAHELAEVIPQAVTGEKDAVNEDGSIRPQGVDYSKIVVHLVAAIKELSAKNDALEARLAALEAK